MRKNFVKRTSALALAAFMAASAAGCSSGGGSRTAAAPDTTAQEAASGEEAKADGDKGETESSGEPVTIRLVHYMGEQAKRDALDAMLAAFNEAHPEIHVDVEVVASSSYIATYKNYIAAGEAPDIMFGKPQTMQEFVDGGYFMDLKDEACMTNVLPMLVDECTVNGGVYGFPIDAQVKATFYNKKMFDEAGVEVPKTKDDFFKVCDTFMDKGIYPMIHPYNFIHGVFHELDSFFTSMAAGTGNENVWMDSQNGVKDLSGNPVVVEAMEMFSKFASYKDAGDTAVDQTQGIQNFAAGQRTSNITVPTDDADAFIKEIKTYIDNDMIVSKSLVPDYTSEYSTAFRTKLQEFVTLDDSQRDVTKLLKDIDDEIGSIRQ